MACVSPSTIYLMTHSLLIRSRSFHRHRCHKQLSADLENSFKDEDFADVTVSFVQCCGSVTFWYGSGSADPCLWPMDPDPEPAIFFLEKRLQFNCTGTSRQSTMKRWGQEDSTKYSVLGSDCSFRGFVSHWNGVSGKKTPVSAHLGGCLMKLQETILSGLTTILVPWSLILKPC